VIKTVSTRRPREEGLSPTRPLPKRTFDPAVGRKSEIRFGLIVGSVLLGALGTTIWLVLTIGMPSHSTRPSHEATIPPTEPRTANIVLEYAGNRCRQMIFDNDTGQSMERIGPCPEVVRDGKGEAPAQGTIRRLDAISKSFSKQ
jgi:hypothetical protein